MKKIVGYCGIICSDCPVLTATRKNDNQERQKAALLFTQHYGREYKQDDINCMGCMRDNSHVFSYCKSCKIRKCGKERKVKNCAHCSEYPCENLSELFNQYSKAKTVLDKIKSKLTSARK